MSKEELLQSILPEVMAECNLLAEHLSSMSRVPTIDEIEVSYRQMMHKIGGKLIEKVALLHNGGHVGNRVKCECGAMAEFINYRPKIVSSMVGTSTIMRAYYHCKKCGGGLAPIDEKLGLNRRMFSRAAERAMCSLAAVEPFELASKHLYDLAGVSVSSKEVQLISEHWGEQAAKDDLCEVDAVFSEDRHIEPESIPEVLCIELDGKMVPMLGGVCRELKVAAVCDLVPGKDPRTARLDSGKTTYLGVFDVAVDFGRHVWLEALRRGIENAKTVVGLGDGAPWIWNIIGEHFPDAVQILDFYHASEHIWDLANSLYGEGSQKARHFASYREKQIYCGKVRKTIAYLRKLKVTDDKKQEKLRLEIGYLEENKDRMNYPLYRKLGYHIGSGMVESACKQFGTRLDQAGMHWLETGAGAIAALRALWLSNRWDKYWKPARAPLYA